MKNVIVLNQFALPRSEGGGTRHIDLFGRLTDWTPLIVAGDRNHYSQRRFSTDDPAFRLVRLPEQRGGATARLVTWLAYAVQAFFVVLLARRLHVVVGSSPQPFAALAGLVGARLRRVPFVLEVRDLWPETMVAAGKLQPGTVSHRAFAALERLLATRASRLICVTEGWEDHFTGLGVDPAALVVVPNGTEPADFAVATPRPELRARAGITGFTAVFAGAHGEQNGLDYLLGAAAQLPQIHFLFVGSGPAKAGCEAQVRRDGLSNVEFRDPVPKQELPALLRACDVGVHTIAPLSVLAQGMSPNKLFDYMAAQLPVVSNARAALRRVLRDGECGRLGAPDELTRCLEDVYAAGPQQRASWGRRAREIVEERYSRTAAARTLADALESAVAGHRQEHRP